MFFVDDRSCCFPGERIKIIEALSLLVYGYLLSSQVMYGIQEAAAACLLLAFAWFLVYFVGRQLQPAACTFAGMLVLKVSEVVGSVVEGLFAFGCLVVWEGESLLAGNSPVGTGEQATGRVDVPGEKQMGAAAAAAAVEFDSTATPCWDSLIELHGRIPVIWLAHQSYFGDSSVCELCLEISQYLNVTTYSASELLYQEGVKPCLCCSLQVASEYSTCSGGNASLTRENELYWF